MTDIDTIREAARQMRSAAQMLVPLVDDLTDSCTWPEAQTQLRRDRDGLPAIADWLDAAARREEEYLRGYAYSPVEGDEVCGALIVARAFLGEQP